jgi:hypothetical protein
LLPEDKTVTLMVTENGAQLLVSGFGLYIGKKGERIVVKQGGKVCAQVPFMRAQEVIIASRGVSFLLLNEMGDEPARIRIIPICEGDLKDMWVMDQYRRVVETAVEPVVKLRILRQDD